jgi:D-inositol-3-phosphate glycosyltransferase
VASTFSLPASDIRIAPVGVDTERFGPGDRRAARTSLDLPDDATILGFFGALDDNKGAGCEDIIRALALEGGAGALGAATPNALDEALLVIVGEGSRLIRLESLATELGVTERVRFSQYVGRDELAAYYLAVDVVVVPSKRESLGLVALEARASGTPVVATRVGGLPEHVEPGVTGELYEPGDVPGLVAALKRVLNPATHTRYSPSLAADRWGLVATGRLLTTITDDVIDKRARRDG